MRTVHKLGWACVSFFAYITLMPSLTIIFMNQLPRDSPFILSDGDKVTCTPFRDLYPAATWHIGPSMGFRDSEEEGDLSSTRDSSIKQAQQVLKVEKRSCGTGRVPTRRPTGKPSLTIRPGRKAYMRRNLPNPTQSDSNALWPEDHNGHKYAVASIAGPYTGTQGRLNVWQPYVEDEEFSLAQVWVASIDKHGFSHSLEAGWQIYKDLYADKRPRLFTFWTTDNYTSSGCYNLECPGFVQTSNKVLLGGSFAAVSTMDSTQFEIKIGIFLDKSSGNWWLRLNDEFVGYWPKLLLGPGAFNFTSGSTTRVDWGGEIWHQPGHYTSTQMGSGQHPSLAGFRKAAYIKFMDPRGNETSGSYDPGP
ncbi:hypothetical protein AXG93_4295s1160 [Marchantia polymorpha subsp. ruderalis]|uniref:Neprosin PEP catalytic domain-containing protein n=1 Tax=Marchantia polymorpha subsp. ruderalis TaxID=1480154 RepID=A0A176WC05_MARPO|nr:hypothetical protein AXG93_4295s1160 [Marchantia polymorpha subsp. ruderalis]